MIKAKVLDNTELLDRFKEVKKAELLDKPKDYQGVVTIRM